MADVERVGTLEQELDALLEQERFDPPEAFVARRAHHRHLAARARGRGTPSPGGASRPTRCTGSRPCRRRSTTATRRSTTWFAGGKLNASYNCLDRHVEAGLGDRVAFHWHGEEGEERGVTYAELLRRRAALRQRAEGARDRRRATSSGSTCR